MVDTNYLSSVIKILETPNQTFNKNNIPVTRFKAQLPQLRRTQIVTVSFWGNLARDVAVYYKKNDYVIVEGYTSINDKQTSTILIRPLKVIEITGLRVYPFFLNPNRSMEKSY